MFISLYGLLCIIVISNCGGSSGPCSGLGSSVGPMDERICEFVLSEITRGILDAPHVMFGTIMYGINEFSDERLRALHLEFVAAHSGVQTLFFWVFKACRFGEFFRKKDPNASRWWIDDIHDAQCASFLSKGLTV